MKQTLAIITVASIIISVLVFSYNYVNVCIEDDNGRFSVSECIDSNLINSTLIIISSIILVYIFILILKFRTDKNDTNYHINLLNDYYNYYDSKRSAEAAKILKDKFDKENKN